MKKIDHSKIIVGIILLVIIANIVFFIFLFQKNEIEKKVLAEEQINILFTVSENNELLFSEVFLYNPKSNKGGLFYIPSNLGIKKRGNDNSQEEHFDKILSIYDTGSLSNFREEIERFMGISIPFVIDISLDDLGRIIDLLGGIEVFISNPVNSEYKGNKILLPSGSVVLDGDKVKIFTTYEENLDSEQSSRKHRVIEGFLTRIGTKEINDFLLNENAFKYLRDFVNINFSDNALKTFIIEMNNLNTEQLVFKNVLGNEKEIPGIDGVVLFPFYEGELIKMNTKQLIDAMASMELEYPFEIYSVIEVLNGTDIPGLAKSVKILFESLGITVLSIGNADNFNYQDTIIINKKAADQDAGRIKEILNCGIVENDFNPESESDIIIILGRDYNAEQE